MSDSNELEASGGVIAAYQTIWREVLEGLWQGTAMERVWAWIMVLGALIFVACTPFVLLGDGIRLLGMHLEAGTLGAICFVSLFFGGAQLLIAPFAIMGALAMHR